MILKFIRRTIVKAIRKRVLKRTYAYRSHETAASFIFNAPLREWRDRLWIVENLSDGLGPCTDEEIYQWLTRN